LALDQVGVMAALGHGRFAVAGHDRGALVTHRLLCDHPEKVTRGAALDIVLTLYRFEQLALVLPDPGPPPAGAYDRLRPRTEYLRCRHPETIRATCDFR
jgi:pimeloyl-ACP methyl ester carboxylesterase